MYPFGVDSAWHRADNGLLFFNSLKMKISVVFGVVQVRLRMAVALWLWLWLWLWLMRIPCCDTVATDVVWDHPEDDQRRAFQEQAGPVL